MDNNKNYERSNRIDILLKLLEKSVNFDKNYKEDLEKLWTVQAKTASDIKLIKLNIEHLAETTKSLKESINKSGCEKGEENKSNIYKEMNKRTIFFLSLFFGCISYIATLFIDIFKKIPK